MNAPNLQLEHRQNQVLTPRLQQAVRLLQLSSLDFAQELQQSLSSNPFLELEENIEETFGDAAEQPFEGAAPAEAPGTQETTVDDLSAFAAGEPWGHGGKERKEGGEPERLELAQADTTLRDHLHGQLNVLPLPERDHLLAALMVEALDDDGYLRVALDDLAALTELDPPVDAGELQYALRLVQSLDPAGVGCRDVQECVRLQLEALPDSAERRLALDIVQQEFKRLAQHDVPALSTRFARKAAEIERICRLIRRLDPRPGWRFANQTAAYLTPDVIVRKLAGGWSAQLNPNAMPKVRLNQMYAELFQHHRESHHGDLALHLQEARWIVRNIEQRFDTILRVAQAIVRRQQNFFEHGTLALQPLGLKDIAEELELHESTVSRATNNKYMATPGGIFELKYFFSRALGTTQGSSCSTTAIRGAIKEMILAEDAQAPLSDAEITRLLLQQGLCIARRTVTKYRQMMHIPSVEMRRQHG